MPRYGRVPDETADLFKKTIATVRNDVLSALPNGAPAKVDAFTLEAVLDVVLRDWRENDNTDGLLAADVADLRSFIELAHSVASPDPYGRGFPIYQATLQGLLEDWLANWNAPGNPGPPSR
jgi:hypothetical protein